jgi:hypothetical protein
LGGAIVLCVLGDRAAFRQSSERNAPPANLAAALFEEELPHGKHHAQRPRPALVVEKKNRIFAARRKSRLRVVAGGVAVSSSMMRMGI